MTCDRALFSTKNSPNSAKRDVRDVRDVRALILTYMDSPTAEVFPHYYFFFFFNFPFKGKWGVKVGPKVQTLGPSLFYKN